MSLANRIHVDVQMLSATTFRVVMSEGPAGCALAFDTERLSSGESFTDEHGVTWSVFEVTPFPPLGWTRTMLDAVALLRVSELAVGERLDIRRGQVRGGIAWALVALLQLARGDR